MRAIQTHLGVACILELVINSNEAFGIKGDTTKNPGKLPGLLFFSSNIT